MFGGGMRQAGVLAAAALHGLEHHRDGLAVDIANARVFAGALSELEGIRLDLGSVESNIVRFSVTGVSAGRFAILCHERGVHMLPWGGSGLRAVLHRDVSKEDAIEAVRLIREVLEVVRVPEQTTLADA
jgi:threonine aldolase